LGHHSRILTRRSVGVPKGFLIFLVLYFLKVKPSSGSELMDEIEGITKWRPSPGSIYPLLSKMSEMGVIVQVESKEPVLKRFALTDKGLEEFELMKEEDAILMDRFRATRRIFWTVIENLDEELFQARDRLITAISEVARLVNGDLEASKRMLEIIEEALERVDTVRKTLEGE
jgi:DNA-binding PadR family transcriptional regulator